MPASRRLTVLVPSVPRQRFECHQCTHCCRHTIVPLTEEDRQRLDGQDWSGLHLHPADTGGMMISLDQPDPPDSWAGAGPHWRDFIAHRVIEVAREVARGSLQNVRSVSSVSSGTSLRHQ